MIEIKKITEQPNKEKVDKLNEKQNILLKETFGNKISTWLKNSTLSIEVK